MRIFASLVVVASLSACEKSHPEPAAQSAPPAPPPAPAGHAERYASPAPERLVAIGDIHGDLDAARRVLRLAGAIDASDAWIGGKLVIVQTGDEVDRGDSDRAVIDLFEKLKGDAKKAGGDVVALCGNHEIMNATGDFRYVSEPAYAAFADVQPKDDVMATRVAGMREPARHRAAAFAPRGPYGEILANRPVVVKIGDTVFVHGGILPTHVVFGLDEINELTRAWLLGKRRDPPPIVVADDGPVWTRLYSEGKDESACTTLAATLDQLKAKRMVMGHTVQHDGITSACENEAWRIDTGMSHVFGGPIQALEIKGTTVTVLK